MTLFGIAYFVEAFEVDERSAAADQSFEEELRGWYRAAKAHSAVSSVEIEGRSYATFLRPYTS